LPATFTANNEGLIEGFATALIGQKVGSQVIAVIPPDLAYGSAGTQSVPAGATLVFVFDVLGIQK
jgi:peptidylprolyl isomerase